MLRNQLELFSSGSKMKAFSQKEALSLFTIRPSPYSRKKETKPRRKKEDHKEW